MQTLLVSTAATPAFLALAEDQTIFRILELPAARSSEAVFAVLQKLQPKPQKIIVATGPGSFTQVRVGVVLANALSKAWQIPIVGIPYTQTPAELLAAGLKAEPSDIAQPLYIYPPHITTPKPL